MQLSRKVYCWCPVYGDVETDVNIDVNADVDVDVPYPVESGWRPRASFDWSKAAQSTKLLWTTALDQLLWHLSWETGNTVQTNQGNALSSQEIVLGQWDDSLKHKAQNCKDRSRWNGHWWFMFNTAFTTIWRKFIDINTNILLVKNRPLWKIWSFGLSIYSLLQSGGLYQRCGCRIKYATKYQIYKMFIKRNSITNIKFTSCSWNWITNICWHTQFEKVV